MKGLHVFSFFFIVLLAFVSCANTSKFSDDIEIGNTVKLRSVRCIENEVDEGEEKEDDGSSDEELIDFDINFSLPIMTLEQFITSLRINCLIFIVYLIFNFKEHGIETLFLFYLAVYNNTYIQTKLPKYENPRNDVQTLSDTRLFHASYSWLVQILLILTSKENLNFIDKVLPRTHFIGCAFLPWK